VVLAQTGTAAVLDYLPALRRLPDWILPPLKRAKDVHRREKALYRYHWDRAKRSVHAGTANPCFSVNLVAEQQNDGFSDDQASYITGTLLEAGSDTTANTLYGFVCALLIYPEVQKRGQAELDRVVGDRLPTLEDEMDLQYIRGCVKEALRWLPTTLMGAVPHALTRDDMYRGYRLPAGAGVINNVYAIHQDPVRYPDPRRFAPERFADDFQSVFDAALNPDVSKRDQFTFGAGRRICPGLHVAERSLFLAISRMLWAFDFQAPIDEGGREIIPDQDAVTQGFVSAPVTYKAIITSRTEKHAEIVRKEWELAVAKDLDPQTMQWRNVPDAMRQSYSQK
jgi:cytochrome P450